MYSYATFGSSDLSRSRAFFVPTLGALGIEAFHDSEHGLAFAKSGTKSPALWVVAPFAGGAASGGNGPMLALDAPTAEAVNAFHASAMAQGGTDEGAPGYREHYAPNFYAAYVRDPFGNKLCAVFRDPARAVPAAKD